MPFPHFPHALCVSVVSIGTHVGKDVLRGVRRPGYKAARPRCPTLCPPPSGGAVPGSPCRSPRAVAADPSARTRRRPASTPAGGPRLDSLIPFSAPALVAHTVFLLQSGRRGVGRGLAFFGIHSLTTFGRGRGYLTGCGSFLWRVQADGCRGWLHFWTVSRAGLVGAGTACARSLPASTLRPLCTPPSLTAFLRGLARGPSPPAYLESRCFLSWLSDGR